MPVIKRSSILQLKARVDILDVVSAVVTLKKAGSKHKGLSPFNNEKTPSFFVSPDKGLYKCFSSGKAGDAISFVMETENLGFTEACEALSRRFNVALEYESGGPTREERSLRQELFAMHDEAAEAFRDAFLASGPDGAFIRDYWTATRRFALEVAEDFKIGFAPPDGGGLLERLRKHGFSDEALRQSGLFFVRGSGALTPRFRGRLMIPIRDPQSRVVAFTARKLEVTPTDDPTHEAKYVNSPETPVFTKGELLFNYDRARKHAKPECPFLMVEGQLDAIRCWTAGLQTTIAPQGTGVTEMQLGLLRRHDAGLECLLDGDSAGQKAALRLLPLALHAGLEVVFLPLPDRTDPDDLLRDGGAAALDSLRAHRLGAMAFAVAAIAPNPREMSPQVMADAARQLFDIIAHSDSAVAQSGYLAEISHLLGINAAALEADYRRQRTRAVRREQLIAASRASDSPAPDDENLPELPDESPPPPPHASAENDLLLILLHYEGLGEQLAHAIDPHWIDTRTRAGRLLDQFLNEFAHKLWTGVQNIEEHLDDPEDRSLVASLLFETPGFDDPVKVANDGIRRMVSNFCVPRKRKIDLEIAAKQGNVEADIVSLQRTALELEHLRLRPPTVRALV